MVIDTHTHIFPEEIRRKRSSYCRRDEGFRLLYENPRARLAGLSDLLASMDHNGIERSVICGFSWEDPVLCREANEYLLQAQKKYPERVIAFANLPLHSLRLAQRELDRCLGGGARGIGEIALYPHGFPSRVLAFLPRLFRPLGRLQIPCLIHMNEPIGHDYPGKIKANLSWVYQLLQQLPDNRLILAHWGGGFFFYELMPEVARLARRVYYDTAASPYLYEPQIYPLALKIVGRERILFGSDFPLLPPQRYFAELDQCHLPKVALAKIKGENAHHFFRPSPPTEGQDPRGQQV